MPLPRAPLLLVSVGRCCERASRLVFWSGGSHERLLAAQGDLAPQERKQDWPAGRTVEKFSQHDANLDQDDLTTKIEDGAIV